MKKKILAATCGLLGACKIFAATPLEPLALASGSESAFFSELPVVLSVTRLQQNLKDVPGFVTVIDAETIRHSGARDLAELLRVVPGFQVAFNAYGAPVATYHGMGSDIPRGLQVLIDGRTEYSALFQGGVSWNLIDVALEDIERIEVLRGSNSPTYGSNSFMGVVNVITRHAASTHGVLGMLSKGNQGIEDRLARIGFGDGVWHARLTAESKRDHGEPLPFDDRKTERVNLRVDSDWPGGNSLRVQAGHLRLGLGIGYEPDADPIAQITNPHREMVVESNFLQLHWRHHDQARGNTELRAYRIEQSMDDFYRIAVAVPPVVLSTNFDNSGRAHRNDLELQHSFERDQLRLVGGAGWRQDVARHAYFYGPGRRVEQTIQRLFGELEWRPGTYLTTNLAATAEDDSLSGRSLAPRAAFNVHLGPEQTIKFIAGKSRRLPTMYEKKADERLYETVGNAFVPVGTLLNVDTSSTGKVRSEEVKSQEIGYLGEFKSLGLTVDARWFREKLKGRIQSYQVRPVTPICPVFEGAACNYNDFFNVTAVKIHGWETQMNWSPTRATVIGLAHARVKIDPRWTSTLAVDQGMIDYLRRSSPRDSTSLSFRQRLLERFTLAASYYDVDDFSWTRNGRTSEYRRLDWRLAYDFRIADARAELAWTVRSDGSNHSEWWSTNGSGVPADDDLLGTRHFVSLRLEY